jgi:hypothetical protein
MGSYVNSVKVTTKLLDPGTEPETERVTLSKKYEPGPHCWSVSGKVHAMALRASDVIE